ncbi:MAG: hypothetical protein AAFR96_03960 [Planctomycetota bacterium]
MTTNDVPDDQQQAGDDAIASVQRAEQAERLAAVSDFDAPPKKKRTLLKAAGAVALLLGVAAFFAPPIAGRVARPIVEERLSNALGSAVRIERVSLGWLSDQRVTGFEILDDALQQQADLDLTLGRSLVSLIAGGWRDLTVEARGTLILERRDDGSISPLPPRSDEPSQPPTLPELAAELSLDGVDIQWREADRAPLRVSGVAGGLSYRLGSVSGSLTGEVSHDAVAGDAELIWNLGGLAVDGSGVSVGSADLTVTFAGVDAELRVALDAAREGEQYRVTLRGDEAFVRLGPGVIDAVASGLGLQGGSPITLGDGRQLTLGELPGGSVTLSNATLTIDPASGLVRDARCQAVIETGGFSGTIDGAGWLVRPVLATVATRDLAQGFEVQAATSITIDGGRAGDVSFVADGVSPIDARGGFRVGPLDLISGSRTRLELREVATGVLEPLVAPMLGVAGLSLTRDLGPELSASVRTAPDGASPGATSLRIDAEAANADAAIDLRIDGTSILTTDTASRVRMASAASLLTGLLGSSGLSVDSGAAIDARLSDLAIDLAAKTPDGRRDLRDLSASVSISIGETAGTLRTGDRVQSVALRPSEAEIDLRSLADRATLAAGAAIEVEGRPAGTLSVSIDATDALGPAGALRPGVPSLAGEISIRGVRGDLFDASLAGLGISGGAVLGSDADLVIVGSRTSDDVSLDVSLDSGTLTAGGRLTIADGLLQNAGPLAFELESVGAIIGGLTPDAYAINPGGRLEASITELRLGADGLTALEIGGELRSLTGQRAAARAELQRLGFAARYRPSDASLEINGIGSVANEPLIIAGRVDVADFRGPDSGIDLALASPTGQIDATLPTAAVALLAPGLDRAADDAIDIAIGDSLDLGLSAGDGTLRLEAQATSGLASASLGAEVGRGSMRITGGEARLTIDPESVRQFRLAAFTSGDMAGSTGFEVASPIEASLTVGAFDVLSGGVPVSDAVAPIRLAASGSVEGLRRSIDASGRAVRSGQIGVEGLVVESSVPLAAMTAAASPAAGTASELAGTITGSIVGDGGRQITSVEGTISVPFVAGKPDGAVMLKAILPRVDTAQLDDAFLTDSLLAGAFGASMSASVELAGIADTGGLTDAGINVEFESPRLRSAAPVAFDIRADRIALASPAQIGWRIDPVFATRHGLHQPAGEESVRLASPIDLAIAIERLAIARDGVALRVAGADLAATIEAPRIVFEHRAETEAQEGIAAVVEKAVGEAVGEAAGAGVEPGPWIRSDFSPLAGRIGTSDTGELTLELTAADSDERGIFVEGRSRELGSEGGVFSLLVEAKQLPTAVIDGIADLGGGLAEIVGPFARLRLGLQELSSRSGNVSVAINGDRASGRLIGRIEDGIFRNEDPISFTVDEIRPQLGRRLARAVPVIGRVTKSRDDGPAMFTATNVAFAIDAPSPLDQLDADFTIDVGTARFQSSQAFGRLLRVTGQAEENEVGRRLEAMVGTVRQGQIEYERFRIPLGEFTLISEGAYHVTTKKTDITTYIPVGALSDQAMGILNTGIGSRFARLIPGLERLTMIPWRVTGVPGNLTVLPDFDALRKDLTKLLNPVNLIEGVVGGVGTLFGG